MRTENGLNCGSLWKWLIYRCHVTSFILWECTSKNISWQCVGVGDLAPSCRQCINNKHADFGSWLHSSPGGAPSVQTRPIQGLCLNIKTVLSLKGEFIPWWRHQMETISASLAIYVRGIHRSPVNSSHKGQWRGALMFSLICAWINDWVNNRETGDLRRHRAHHDVTVMAGKTASLYCNRPQRAATLCNMPLNRLKCLSGELFHNRLSKLAQLDLIKYWSK